LPRVARLVFVLLLVCAGASLAGTSTSPNPVVTFVSPGPKQVQLRVCNANGCTTITKTVSVLDPRPVVTALSVSPATVPQGGTTRFTATGTGKPPLTFRWRVVRSTTGVTVATLFGATVDWTASAAPGTYNVFLDLVNAAGSQTPPPRVLTVTAGPLIFADGFETGLSRWLKSP
jgi:PKD repeat protein